MRLSNTMMMNESLLPTGKKAFTLAEVLITLSILGVVAALTIPSLVNRQSDLAAQVKLKKAISNFEDFGGVYMAENEADGVTDLTCDSLANYFKQVQVNSSNKCQFTTADGVAWNFEVSNSKLTGRATAADAYGSPRYGVSMWILNGQVNGQNKSDGVANAPTGSVFATLYSTEGLIDSRKVSAAPDFLQGKFFCKTNDASIAYSDDTSTITCAQ